MGVAAGKAVRRPSHERIRCMKTVQWTDEHGFNRLALVPGDFDGDPRAGLPLEVPDLIAVVPDRDLRRDRSNQLIARRLLTWEQVLAQQSGVTTSIRTVAARHGLS